MCHLLTRPDALSAGLARSCGDDGRLELNHGVYPRTSTVENVYQGPLKRVGLSASDLPAPPR